MLRFVFYKIGQFIVNILPLSAAYAFSQTLSDLQYAFSITDRRNVRANIRKILNRENIDERLVREVFRNFGRYLVDFFRMVRYVDEEFVRTKVKVEGLEHFKNALSAGKGVILVTAHIGNWELGGLIFNRLGYPVLAVALPHTHKLVNGLFNEQREKSGVTVVTPNVAVRRCLEKLKDKESIALVADRDFGPHGLMMDFLGHKTLLPKGPAVLSIKTGAPIVVTFMIRNPDNTFTMSFYPAVYPALMSDQIVEDHVLKDIIEKYIKVVEDKIREFPGQWLMFRKFWVVDNDSTGRNTHTHLSDTNASGEIVAEKGKVNP